MQSDTWDRRDAQKMLRKNGGKKTPKALLTQWAFQTRLQSGLFKVLRTFNKLIPSSLQWRNEWQQKHSSSSRTKWKKNSKIDYVCPSARHRQTLQAFRVSLTYRYTAQTRHCYPNRVINLQMLFCNHQRSSRVEGDRGRKGGKAELARGESSLLCPALAAPGPTPSPATHPCPWCSWIAFHPLQFYTNKAILWSQHSYESLHTFLGWNTNCLTSQSKLHNCSQDGIKEAASN